MKNNKKTRFKERLKKNIKSDPILSKWKLLLYILIAGYLYSAIHEIVHYSVFHYFGYSAEFCWTCIPTQVKILTPLNEVLKNHYFISVIAPYLLSIILLSYLLFIYLITKNKIWKILAITPFLDIFVNILAIPIAYFTKTPNDFLNLFRIGFS